MAQGRARRAEVSFAPLALSFKVAALATVLATIVGVAIAVALVVARLYVRDCLDALTTAPMVLPPTVLGYFLLVSLGQGSVLGSAYERVTGGRIVFSVAGAVIAATVGSLPLVIKAARAALEGVDPTLVAAARTLGA